MENNTPTVQPEVAQALNQLKREFNKPRRVFFFQRADGSIFATEEKEASSLVQRKQQVMGAETIRPKLIGTGEGEIFRKALMEAQLIKDPIVAGDIIKKGQIDELLACKGNVIMPRNFDKIGPGAHLM